MLGNEEDFSAALGFEVQGVDEDILQTRIRRTSKRMIEKVVLKDFPFQVVATTLRKANTRHTQRLGRHLLHATANSTKPPTRNDLEIYDRVGGGDSFASGLIYGFLAGKGPQWAVECGAAHGALAMTTPGDTTMATLKEVEQVMKGAGARIVR